MWVNCEEGYVSSSYRPVSCDSVLCTLANSHACDTECYSTPKPDCHNNTCAHSPGNPVIHLSTGGQIGQDIVSLQSFNGKTPDRIVSVPNFPFVCSSTLIKFSICLSSSTKPNGAILFGDGPRSIVPKDLLIYTPLIKNPVSTLGPENNVVPTTSSDYFISVNSIRVGGKDIKVNKTLLSINNKGKGGTRISTIKPYTMLHTSLYKALVTAFVRAYGVIPHVEPPFGACFPSFSDELGPKVPFIDLVLEGQGSVYWRISSANSLVKISSIVTCLGFVDGGPDPFTSIVIGGCQLEDNLLQFDLASSRLGFSSSLLARNTSCSNFT
ncbi:ATP binding protein, putative [Ricinus communis]|uniref:ATP binding protein, putative n=1 Tax=Ricinus communis TaxID=3988 RepID=B9RTU7_RICCO|nr:ATP binding protein, putative [Ricinus communis]|eukprot:XP_025012760.1 basic 7S globulin-like [Ricinus communis]